MEHTEEQLRECVAHSQAAAAAAITIAGLGPLSADHVIAMLAAVERRGLTENGPDLGSVISHAIGMFEAVRGRMQ